MAGLLQTSQELTSDFFVFECAEESHHCRIVVAITLGAHRANHSSLGQRILPSVQGVSGSAVAANDEARGEKSNHTDAGKARRERGKRCHRHC